MSAVNHDPVVVCPYDSNHKIAKSRIQKHLVKCEKNFPPGFKKQCPYDATHRVSPHLLIAHTKDCPMRYMYPIELGQSVLVSTDVTMEREDDTIDNDDEVWDEDLPNPSTVDSSDEQFLALQKRFVVKRYNKELRRPYGRSESLMLEATDDDTQSEISDIGCKGIGRGRPIGEQYQRGNGHIHRGIGGLGIRGRLLR